MEIQWYPGHMKKAIRQMQEDMKLIDLVIEIMDARIPMASRNPDIDQMFQGKARILILNKTDLADESVTASWISYYQQQGFHVIAFNAKDARLKKTLGPLVEEAVKKKRERDLKRGIKSRPVRSMIVGIPNSGKSTFINTYAGKASAKTGNKPGVTRGKQWIRLSKTLELLDTPGILWPKFEEPAIGYHLAYVGSIRDEILGKEELCVSLMKELELLYPGRINEHYGLSESPPLTEILYEIAKLRKCLKVGGEPDTGRVADFILDDFRNGRLGRISLERPNHDER